MAPKRYLGAERAADLIDVTSSRWRQLRSEQPEAFPDHQVEIGDPTDPSNPRRQPKRGYSLAHVQQYRRWRSGDGRPPPRRRGEPKRYASAQWIAEQLGRDLTRVSQLRADDPS